MANCNLLSRLSRDHRVVGASASVGWPRFFLSPSFWDITDVQELINAGLNRELLDLGRVVFSFAMVQEHQTQPSKSQRPPIRHLASQTGDPGVPFDDTAAYSPPHTGSVVIPSTQLYGQHRVQALHHPPPQFPFSPYDRIIEFANPSNQTLTPNIPPHQNTGQLVDDLPSPRSLTAFSQSGFSLPPVSPNTGDYQTDEQSDPVAEEKRRRNTAASAQFRNKKKQATLNLERSVSNLSDRAAELEREAADLRRENGWLKEIAILKGNQAALKERVSDRGR